MGLCGDRLGWDARITEARRIIDQRPLNTGGTLSTGGIGSGVADKKPVDTRTGRGGGADDTRSTQNLASVDRHLWTDSFAQVDRRMTTASSIFFNEVNVSGGTPKTADKTRGGILLRDWPIPILSSPSGALVF